MKAIGRLYMSLVKSLLGVRISTPNDLCLIELGYPTVKGRIQQAQSRFFRKIIREREGMVDVCTGVETVFTLSDSCS